MDENCFLCGENLAVGEVQEVDGNDLNLLLLCSEVRKDGKASALREQSNGDSMGVTLHMKCRKLYCFCFICNEDLTDGQLCTVKEKGLRTFINCSQRRGDGKGADVVGLSYVTVHEKCRKTYTNEKSINAALNKRPRELNFNESDQEPTDQQPTRDPEFKFKEKCLFCEDTITEQFLLKERKKPHSKRTNVFKIRKPDTKNGIIQAARKHDDDWSKKVLKRIRGIDLQVVGAQYHQRCYSSFCLPSRPSQCCVGRPPAASVSSAMDRIFEYLEENKEQCQFTLRELRSLVDNPPSDPTLKQKLEERYQNDIVFTSDVGRPTVICFRTHQVLHDSWYNEKDRNENEERLRIVRTAAAIIAEDIGSQIYDSEYYPVPEKFLDDIEKDVPESLRVFLDDIIVKPKRKSKDTYKKKCLSIAHAIIAAARPRSFLSSLQVGLAAYLHSKFGSKTLTNVLSKLGFCAAYDEAQTLELSAALHSENITGYGFHQFVADNANINVDTLDGHGKFLSMGMIDCITPEVNDDKSFGILRVTDAPSATVLGTFGHFPIQTFEKRKAPFDLDTLTVEKICIAEPIIPRLSDLLWLYGKSNEIPGICGWNGFMESLTSKNKYVMSQIIPMPVINASPSDYNTVYTTLLQAVEKCEKMRQKTCIITFDQPLYQIARDIISSTSDPRLQFVVIRLGGFHMLMSFLGSVGYIMSGSGLKELFSIIYTPLSVEKIMSGHAYSRAVRGHVLAHLALGKIILEHVNFTNEERAEIEKVLTDFDDGKCGLKLNGEPFRSISRQFEAQLKQLESNGPTAKLWVQYHRMVSLVKHFIEAERSGNWDLHLSTVSKMIPFFHATGHFNYAYCCQLYLQDMQKLEEVLNLQEYQKFVRDGYFTIRRSDKLWAGIWSDMLIEQVLVKSMKVMGGLIHRGMTDSVQMKYIHSVPSVVRISQSLEEFADVLSSSSEQHFGSSPSRQERDDADVGKLSKWFSEHNPFPNIDVLVSLGTGIVGGPEINCHKAEEIGSQRLDGLVGKAFGEISFSMEKRVLPLSSVSSSIKIADDIVAVDPYLLYQRIILAKKSEEDLKRYLTYELSPFPISLFNELGMRKSKNSALYDLFSPMKETIFAGNVRYVIDGGFLLHAVVWQRGAYFSFICQQYLDYVEKHYKTNAVIVFDGYCDDVTKKSTKTAERLRRSTKGIAAETIFEETMQVTVSQETFLANEKNISRLISVLKQKFELAGYIVKQHETDADVLIVNTALEMSEEHSVVIVGEDIDLLVILTGIVQNQNKNVYFIKPGGGKVVYSPECLKDSNIAQYILFYHAFSGCDTTSAIFNKGKLKITNLLMQSQYLKEAMDTFMDGDSDITSIEAAGEKVLVALYGGKENDSLNNLRYSGFSRSITKSKFDLASLPPTKAAALQHSLRTFHQIQHWLGNELPAESWGWKQERGGLTPVPTLKDPAPKEILEYVQCRCPKECGGKCSCKISGLKCSEACHFCRRQACINAKQIDVDESDFEDDEPSTVTEWKSQTNHVGEPVDTFPVDDRDFISDKESGGLRDEIDEPEETAELSSEDEESSNRGQPRKKLKRS